MQTWRSWIDRDGMKLFRVVAVVCFVYAGVNAVLETRSPHFGIPLAWVGVILGVLIVAIFEVPLWATRGDNRP